MFLTALKLRKLTKPGLYSDGGNLYLQVRGPQQRSWLFRYMIQGRARSMGLGHIDDVSLVEARNKADAARKQVREGTDPLDARKAAEAKAKAITFGEACTLMGMLGCAILIPGPQKCGHLATASTLCDREAPRRGDRHRSGAKGPQPDLAREAGERVADTRADREGSVLRHRARLALRSQPGGVARASAIDPTGGPQGASRPAFRGVRLARGSGVHGEAPRTKGTGARAGFAIRWPPGEARVATGTRSISTTRSPARG